MKQCKRKQKGAVLIIVAICLPVLIGFLGLVVDLGRLYITKTELQSALDACALAAAYELDGATDALVRARNAGKTVGNDNKVNFQAVSASITDADISFSETLTPFTGTALAADARYAQCTSASNDIPSWFMQILGIAESDVSALAVASRVPSQASCAVPVMICTNPTPVPSTPFGWQKGDWVAGTADSSENVGGNFKWADFTGPGGGNKEIKNLLAGSGHCAPASPQIYIKHGNNEGAVAAWNTRFGIYSGGYKGPADGSPDFSGYSYYSASTPPGMSNKYPDFVNQQRPAQTAYQGNLPQGINAPTDWNSNKAFGSNRRVVAVPVVDYSIGCATNPGSNPIPVKGYACMLMLHPLKKGSNGSSGGQTTESALSAGSNGNGNGGGQGNGNGGNGGGGGGGGSSGGGGGNTAANMWLEYLGDASSADSPCTTYGLAGSGAGPLVSALVR